MQPSNLAAQLLGSSYVTNKERSLTQKLWRDFNFERALVDPGYGGFHFERGQSGVGNFTLTQATSGTGTWIASSEAGYPPVLALDSGATTDNQGPQIQYTGIGLYPTAGMEVNFEFMARMKGNGTAGSIFGGLATIDTTLIASDLMSAADWVGFLAKASATMVFGSDDGTEDLSTTAAHTVLNGTSVTDGTEWMHHGFKWVVGEEFEVYIQRAKVDASDVAITAEPDGAVVVSFATQSAGTTQPILEIANWAFGYINNKN